MRLAFFILINQSWPVELFHGTFDTAGVLLGL